MGPLSVSKLGNPRGGTRIDDVDKHTSAPEEADPGGMTGGVGRPPLVGRPPPGAFATKSPRGGACRGIFLEYACMHRLLSANHVKAHGSLQGIFSRISTPPPL